MPPAAVIFDLDDTLVAEMDVARASLVTAAGLLEEERPDRVADVVSSTARALWRTGPFHDLAMALGIASWEGLWATFEGSHPSLDGLKAWIPSYRSAAWRGALVELGRSDDEVADAMSAAFVAAQHRGHHLLPGAAELVERLAGRCRIGLLTNGPADIQRLKFEGTGLARFFDAVVVSGELGVGKPEQAVFQTVLEALGASALETVMVGDSWGRDVLGARGAEMAAIWLAGGRPVPEDDEQVIVVEDIAEAGALPLWH